MTRKPQPHMRKYLQYIINTAAVPLDLSFFDDDWEPAGTFIRFDLEEAGLIRQEGMNIWLTDAGRDYLNAG